MAFVHYHKKPELRNPVVVAAFAGWNDAADAATTAIKFLIDRWKPVKFGKSRQRNFTFLLRPGQRSMPAGAFSA